MIKKIFILFFVLGCTSVVLKAQSTYSISISPRMIDFGNVPIGEHRDTTITGIYYPGHYWLSLTANILFRGDSTQFSIDKNSMTLYYSDLMRFDTIHLHFEPKKVGATSGSITVYFDKPTYLSEGAGFYGVGIDSTLSVPKPLTKQMGSSSLKISPNPVLHDGTIYFSLIQTEFVSLKLYDLLGREVKELANNILTAGEHHIPFNTLELPKGVYSLILRAGLEGEVEKLIVQ